MLPATIGHVSTETTIGIYSHITDTIQQQVAVKIDRHIGGTNAEMPKHEERMMVEPPCPKSSHTDPKCANLERVV